VVGQTLDRLEERHHIEDWLIFFGGRQSLE
jgi:hypothetical protein